MGSGGMGGLFQRGGCTRLGGPRTGTGGAADRPDCAGPAGHWAVAGEREGVRHWAVGLYSLPSPISIHPTPLASI